MCFRSQAPCSLLTPVLLLQHALFRDAKDIVVAGMAWKERHKNDEYSFLSPDANPVITTFHLLPLGETRGSGEGIGQCPCVVNLSISFNCKD